jgi:tetratricopeptide (TPR) repeat protein
MNFWNLKQLSVIVIIAAFTFFSYIFNCFLQFVLAVVFVSLILPIILTYFKSYDKKLYILIVTVVLLVATVLYSIWTQANDLLSIVTYIPFLAGLTFAFAIAGDINKSSEKITLINEGVEFCQEKKFQEALDIFDEALELDPKDYQIRVNRASTLGMLGRYNETIKASDEILQKHPNDLLVLNLKAHALLKIGKFDESLKIVEKTIEEQPSEDYLVSIALANKGEILSEKGHYPEAIEYYDQALEKLPLKKSWKRQGSGFFKMTSLYHQLAEIWFSKGIAHQKLQQYDEASISFDQALKLDPDNKDVLNAKKRVLRMIGN